MDILYFRPVIITDVVQRWPAYNWTGEFFNEHYGKEQVLMKTVDVIIHYVWALMAVLSFNFYKYFLHIVKVCLKRVYIYIYTYIYIYIDIYIYIYIYINNAFVTKTQRFFRIATI